MSIDITLILGSKSDLSIAEKVTKILNEFEIPFDMHIASAHRSPDLVKKIINESSAKVFITIAGLSAALPGVVAAHTFKPVIGVPVSGKVNLDSILSIIQMPPGIPVAAVGLDNGTNAGLLAIQILGLNNPSLIEKISDYRANSRNNIEKANEELNQK
jgi:5-(carboxyamino)imidazole ribonucleotide mutase